MAAPIAAGNASLLDPWFEAELVCPRDKRELTRSAEMLACARGHRYPIVKGIPVFLDADGDMTMPKAFARSLSLADGSDPDAETSLIDETGERLDPWVRNNLTTTCGKRLFGRASSRFTDYPIPPIPLRPPQYPGERLLDIGCNWGRWSIAAARLGYMPIGIDPMLEAVFAARRVATQLGLRALFLCGDARHLPFRDSRFEVVHSYGVFQHFSKPNAQLAIAEAGRVLSPGGRALVQVAGAFGLLALYRRVGYWFRYGFGDPGGFEVRPWGPGEIRSFFGRTIGPTELWADGYFTILPQPGDLKLLDSRHQMLIRLSIAMCAASRILPGLLAVADSFYAASRKPAA